jgi:hypothetical protein
MALIHSGSWGDLNKESVLMNQSDFVHAVIEQLQADGYTIHRGEHEHGEQLAGRYWFCWSKAGMTEAESGDAFDSELEAWNEALQHRLANSAIALNDPLLERRSPMGAFYPARLPDDALDPKQMAVKFQIPIAAAEQQVKAMRRQAVYMNEVYQVNVGLVEAPFGPACGDVAWLSIKRRDRAAVHDWRDLQEIKNRIVGADHEGFEIYPAESRLVDTANQYHVWVFLDPKVRLPVGFQRREVMSRDAAAAVGAVQRELQAV